MIQKILFISNSLSALIRFRSNFVEKLYHKGSKIYSLAANDQSTTHAFIDKHYDLTISRGGINIYTETKTLADMWLNIKVLQPNLVISYTIKPNCYAPIVCKILNIPVICVVTGLGYAYSNKGFAAFMGRQLLRIGLSLSSYVLTLNEHDRSRLCQQNRKLGNKIDILPGEGVDTNRYRSNSDIRSNKTSFVLIARLLKDKGVYEFIEAARILRKKNLDLEFILMGPQDNENPARVDFAYIQEAIDQGIISYKPPAEDVRPTIEDSTCIVLPSYHEGMPRILLEAASMERPMIATNIPGCNDIVIDQETGLLCEPRSVESLIKTMESFISLSHEEKIHMGKRARQRVIDHFSDEIVIKKYEEVIDKVVREHKAKA